MEKLSKVYVSHRNRYKACTNKPELHQSNTDPHKNPACKTDTTLHKPCTTQLLPIQDWESCHTKVPQLPTTCQNSPTLHYSVPSIQEIKTDPKQSRQQTKQRYKVTTGESRKLQDTSCLCRKHREMGII